MCGGYPECFPNLKLQHRINFRAAFYPPRKIGHVFSELLGGGLVYGHCFPFMFMRLSRCIAGSSEKLFFLCRLNISFGMLLNPSVTSPHFLHVPLDTGPLDVGKQ